jgi:hypothetical protein
LGLAGIFLTVFCAAAFLTRRTQDQPLGPFARQLRAPWFYCLLLILALLIVRLPTFLPWNLNADEGQFLAGAMKLRRDPVFWRAVDGGSSGPFNYYPLLLLCMSGLGFDFPTARLLNVICVGGIMAFLYLIGRLLLPDWSARLVPLPVLAVAMYFRSQSYLHYSSECFPSLLIAAGTWMLFSNQLAERPSRVKYAVLGAIAAMLPFAKLQSAPMAAILGTAAMAGIFIRRDGNKWRLAGYLAASHLAVLAAILLATWRFGVFPDLATSYMAGNIDYANQMSTGPNPAVWFVKYLFQRPDMYWFEGAGAVWLAGAAGYSAIRKASPPNRFLVFTGYALLAATSYAIYRPMRPTGHYLTLLLFPIGLVSALMLGWISRTSSGIRTPLWPSMIFAVANLAAPAVLRSQFCSSELWMAQIPRRVHPDAASEALSNLAKPGEPVAIWGWAPHYFVLTGTIHSVRDSVTAGQIYSGSLQGYYRHRFMEEMRHYPPVVFADAVGSGQPVFNDRHQFGHEIFPELNDYVAANYRLVSDLDGVRLYRLR